MRNLKPESLLFQALDFDRHHPVRPADTMAQSEKKAGDSAHPRSRNSDQMHAPRRPVRKLGERSHRFIGPSQNSAARSISSGDVFSGMRAARIPRAAEDIFWRRASSVRRLETSAEKVSGKPAAPAASPRPRHPRRPGIESLVVIGRVWIGDKNGGQPELREAR